VHEPWTLYSAHVVRLEDELMAAAGVRPAGEHLRALFSPGVRTQFGPPSIVA